MIGNEATSNRRIRVSAERGCSMRPTLLLNIRRRGSDRDRIISGDCSACGDTLIAWLDDDNDEPKAELFRARLDTLFKQHVAETHSDL